MCRKTASGAMTSGIWQGLAEQGKVPEMNGSTSAIFRIAGLVACLVAAVPTFINALFAGPQQAARTLAAFLGLGVDRVNAVFWAGLSLQCLGVLAFAAAFWASTRPPARPARTVAILLIAQTLLGLVTVPDLLLIVAAELPFVLPLRTALAWLAVQSAGMAMMSVYAMDRMRFSLTASIGPDTVPMDSAPIPLSIVFLMAVVSGIAWQAFAFCMGYIAAAERGGRIRLARVHAELVAMQQLLAESARTSERLRIARDLHDGLGHHLAALSLHLDLAARQVAGKAAEPIRTSHDIARQLLVEVRTAVGAERAEQPIRLRQALQTLCSGIPAPRIELSFDDALDVGDPALAHVIFRSVQEAISNAVRHSGAGTVDVALSVRDGGIAVDVSDNGWGTVGMRPGNGLRGMRERIEAHGGSLETASGRGDGFVVRIWLPQRENRP